MPSCVVARGRPPQYDLAYRCRVVGTVRPVMPTGRLSGNAGREPRDRLTVGAPRLLPMDDEQRHRAVEALTALLIPLAREMIAASPQPLDIVGDIERS